MQLKGKTLALIFWALMTLALVLISAWAHRLATHTPSTREAQLIQRNFEVMLQSLEQRLQWLAAHPELTLEQLPAAVDVRLVVDRQDLLQYDTRLQNADARDSLLSSLVNFLKVPRQGNTGVTYWRDKVLLMVVEEQDQVISIAATFLGDWLLQLSAELNYRLSLSADPLDPTATDNTTALIRLSSMVGQPVYVTATALSDEQVLPFLWWLSVAVSAAVSGVIVWTLYYRPIWKRLQNLLLQTRQIMKSGQFHERVLYQGRDEIAETAVQINGVLSSLEYCYNLMAKTNMITTELLEKVDRQSAPALESELTEEGELKSSLDVVARLSEAFQTDALDLFVQPVFAEDRQRVVGYEALARWMDPEVGMVAPAEFVSMCEKAGLLDMMTTLVLRHGLNALHRLREHRGQHLTMSINLSASQFFSPALVTELSSLDAEDKALLPALEFEIREATVTHDFEQAVLVIRKLKQFGVRICIDDYGLSRYSLMYLQRLPVDAIKLSAAFTERLIWEDRQSAFIDGIARFAAGLGVRVIVKHIETEQQLETLAPDLPVEYQGVALAPPAPLDVALER